MEKTDSGPREFLLTSHALCRCATTAGHVEKYSNEINQPKNYFFSSRQLLCSWGAPAPEPRSIEDKPGIESGLQNLRHNTDYEGRHSTEVAFALLNKQSRARFSAPSKFSGKWNFKREEKVLLKAHLDRPFREKRYRRAARFQTRLSNLKQPSCAIWKIRKISISAFSRCGAIWSTYLGSKKLSSAISLSAKKPV